MRVARQSASNGLQWPGYALLQASIHVYWLKSQQENRPNTVRKNGRNHTTNTLEAPPKHRKLFIEHPDSQSLASEWSKMVQNIVQITLHSFFCDSLSADKHCFLLFGLQCLASVAPFLISSSSISDSTTKNHSPWHLLRSGIGNFG